jgi:hypothetical protein
MLVQITVLESLVYSARLRFPKDVPRNVVFAFVQQVCHFSRFPIWSHPPWHAPHLSQGLISRLLKARSFTHVLHHHL